MFSGDGYIYVPNLVVINHFCTYILYTFKVSLSQALSKNGVSLLPLHVPHVLQQRLSPGLLGEEERKP